MSKLLRNLLSATFLTLAAGGASAEPGADTVVASVNGENITLGHMIMVRNALPQQYAQLPNDVLFPGILDQLIQQTALAQSLEGELPRRVTLTLENEERSLKASEVIEKIVAGAVNEASIKAAYEADFAASMPGREYNASHILVETEETANSLVTELDSGADFAELAKNKSTGPSGPRGGQLGWFGEGAMVPQFEEAVKGLEVGAISKPIQTQFGWHVILLNETRLLDTPPLEEVRAELEEKVRMAAVEKAVDELTKAAKVDKSPSMDLDPSVLSNIDLLGN